MSTIYYFIYKTTNIKNGRYYIGAHTTTDLNDSYLGSGVALQRAIKRYGSDSFQREILFIASNRDEMYEKEAELVTESIVRDKRSYNLVVGGFGSSNGFTRDAINASAKKRKGKTWEEIYGIEEATRLKKLKSKQQTGKKRPAHSEFMKGFNKGMKRPETSERNRQNPPRKGVKVTNSKIIEDCKQRAVKQYVSDENHPFKKKIICKHCGKSYNTGSYSIHKKKFQLDKP